jgi:hypothetical protein
MFFRELWKGFRDLWTDFRDLWKDFRELWKFTETPAKTGGRILPEIAEGFPGIAEV